MVGPAIDKIEVTIVNGLVLFRLLGIGMKDFGTNANPLLVCIIRETLDVTIIIVVIIVGKNKLRTLLGHSFHRTNESKGYVPLVPSLFNKLKEFWYVEYVFFLRPELKSEIQRFRVQKKWYGERESTVVLTFKLQTTSQVNVISLKVVTFVKM